MKKIFVGITGCWYYLWGHVFGFILYDMKYLRGKWFEGKFGGICAQGWRWVTHDAVGQIFGSANKDARFPCSQECRIVRPFNIEFDPDDLNNFQGFGNYFQAIGKIYIGKGTYIAPNVGLITSNHDLNDLDHHLSPEDIVLGEQCWIGMNSVILPGVKLGIHTIVGAGSVVTKSFEDGFCIIAGNPAKIIRKI